MSVILEVLGIESTANVADVDLRQIAPSEWTLASSSTNGNGGSVVTYVNNTTSGRGLMTLVVTTRTNPKEQGVGMRHITVKLNGKVRADDSMGSTTTYVPLTASLTVDIPLFEELTAATLSAFVQNLFGVLFPSASSGVAATTVMGKFITGVGYIA